MKASEFSLVNNHNHKQIEYYLIYKYTVVPITITPIPFSSSSSTFIFRCSLTTWCPERGTTLPSSSLKKAHVNKSRRNKLDLCDFSKSWLDSWKSFFCAKAYPNTSNQCRIFFLHLASKSFSSRMKAYIFLNFKRILIVQGFEKVWFGQPCKSLRRRRWALVYWAKPMISRGPCLSWPRPDIFFRVAWPVDVTHCRLVVDDEIFNFSIKLSL